MNLNDGGVGSAAAEVLERGRCAKIPVSWPCCLNALCSLIYRFKVVNQSLQKAYTKVSSPTLISDGWIVRGVMASQKRWQCN